MSAIDAVVAHFETLETKTVEVPEWGDLVIYVEPMTLLDQRKLTAKTKGKDNVEGAVSTIIMFAKDGQGGPLFTLEDKAKLMRAADVEIVGRVAKAILDAHDEGADAGN
jgi:hypothetical protein